MTRLFLRCSFLAAAAVLLAACGPKPVDEAALRARLAERMPQLPKVDEVRPSGIAGLYELRVGTDLFYADAEGNHLIVGELYDTKTRTNLTQQRLDALYAIDFDKLEFKDAMVAKQGSGARRLVVFADPNCGYCKGFERELVQLKDVTIYTFLYPVLGADSDAKSRDIWCTKDPQASWRAWMIDGRAPDRPMSQCDVSAIGRNVAFGRKHRLQGTPAVVFEDGKRVPGAMPLAELERRLAEVKPKSS